MQRPLLGPVLMLAVASITSAAAISSAPVAPRAGRIFLQAKGGVSDLSQQMREVREAMAADE